MKRILLFFILISIVLTSCSTSKNLSSSKNKEQLILISTNYGDIKLKLYNETPLHKANMIKLVNEHFYDSLLFHRVINHFMIQGGDPLSRQKNPEKELGETDTNYTIPAEFSDSLYHKKGALAAARTPDNINPKKESSGSQFYIVQGKVYTDAELDNIEKKSGKKYTPEQRNTYKTTGGTPFLDHNYTVFGEVVEGLDVVDKIASVKTDKTDKPLEPVRMYIQLIKK